MLGGGGSQVADGFHVHATPSVGAEAAQGWRWAKCQPWFYLRLAPRRGTMALLGCPREHMVPHRAARANSSTGFLGTAHRLRYTAQVIPLSEEYNGHASQPGAPLIRGFRMSGIFNGRSWQLI